MEDDSQINDEIINPAMNILKNFPLCDRCLGRQFAKLGIGYSNVDRGKSIKMVLLMHIHKKIKYENLEKEKINDLLINMGSISYNFYKNLFGNEPSYKKCYLCKDTLDKYIYDTAIEISNKMKNDKIKKFLIGVKVDEDIISKEEKLKSTFKLSYGESIKNELKREIGKRIQQLDPEHRADFNSPEVIYEVSFPNLEIREQIVSLLIYGRYKKFKRGISIIGPKSKNSVLNDISKAFNAGGVVVHVPERDESEFRTLGKGSSIILEVKGSKKEDININLIEGHSSIINIDKIERKRGQLNSLSNRNYIKIYRVLILCENKIKDEYIEKLNNINNINIQQKVNRKNLKGIGREIKCYRITSNVIECLISMDQNLYIKEFINGNKSNPSVSSILENNCDVIESDLLSFE
ncbi:putative pseudouridylate synthase [Caldisphaera lagunensis DSM 15908]|uniref:tRNA pseudouridine(55) synthase n=1 Tax=Caldisphaera lagunensis (strain DSM 15908 / JCM 11604 / ANMR 0165 / IC-154) TaxID=1056495 RepID=L0AAV8_CALLD|nr:pseudouridylate synthase [Caldisphaera lagunensis]AFZ70155.1 putative pseudouridylate synthase [Caldisphaera lagunensis DSM 15908]